MIETVKSGPLQFEFDLSTGAFLMRDTEADALIFESASAAVKFARDGRRLCTLTAESRQASNADGSLVITNNFKNSPYALKLEVSPIDESAGFKLKLTIDNNGP
ncbi:MAG: hypothetical protein WCX65_20315, partial [bacterium]